MADTEKLRDCFSQLACTPIWEPRPPTFFEVLGIQHQELAASQLVAFFLDPAAAHGLDDAFLRSLLKASEHRPEELLPAGNARVDTEVTTSSGTRIDILVETDRFCLCIENKLYAPLYNDLSQYRKYVKARASGTFPSGTGRDVASPRQVICVVLGLQDHHENEEVKSAGFDAITYDQLLDKLDVDFNSDGDVEGARYLILLSEFVDTIRRLKGLDPVNKEFLQLLQERHSEVVEAAKQLEEFRGVLHNRVRRVRDNIDDQVPSGEVGWRGYWSEPLFDSIVYRIPDGELGTVDVSLRLSAKFGWMVRIRGLDVSMNELESWFEEHRFDVRRSDGEQRLLLHDGSFDFDEDIDTVSSRFLEFLTRVSRELNSPTSSVE